MLSKGLFWRLAHKDALERQSVIFGTIHLPIDHEEIINQINRYIHKYEFIYTETSLDISHQKLILPHMTMPIEEWSSHISDRQLLKLKKVLLKSYNIDFGTINHLRPMFLMSLIYQSLHTSREAVKLDQYIWESAQHTNKKLRGIESIHQQIEILNKIPLDYDFRLLMKWCRNINKMNKKFKSLIEAYYDQSILSLSKHSKSNLSSIKNLLIDRRNEAMTETIIAEHLKHPALFTFGAGHLAGANGILRLLKNKGFVIKRL